jgi:transcriptional regulator with XRE-family HTH domain
MAAEKSFAAKLDRVFAMKHKVGDRELSYETVAAGITAMGGAKISASNLRQLRTGKKTNPTIDTTKAIAAYFGVPAAYFLDDDAAERIDSELELLNAMRDRGVNDLAVRAADLSPESISGIAALINTIRTAEGLPND